jgi:bacterioferritin (cytochrome b1)
MGDKFILEGKFQLQAMKQYKLHARICTKVKNTIKTHGI